MYVGNVRESAIIKSIFICCKNIDNQNCLKPHEYVHPPYQRASPACYIHHTCTCHLCPSLSRRLIRSDILKNEKIKIILFILDILSFVVCVLMERRKRQIITCPTNFIYNGVTIGKLLEQRSNRNELSIEAIFSLDSGTLCRDPRNCHNSSPKYTRKCQVERMCKTYT